jgi:hypothetical protein
LWSFDVGENVGVPVVHDGGVGRRTDGSGTSAAGWWECRSTLKRSSAWHARGRHGDDHRRVRAVRRRSDLLSAIGRKRADSRSFAGPEPDHNRAYGSCSLPPNRCGTEQGERNDHSTHPQTSPSECIDGSSLRVSPPSLRPSSSGDAVPPRHPQRCDVEAGFRLNR